MAKGYNRRNLLVKIINVQEEYLLHHNSGLSNIEIYRRYIAPRFYIGVSAFYRYLATNAKAEIKKLDTAKRQQAGLFDDINTSNNNGAAKDE